MIGQTFRLFGGVALLVAGLLLLQCDDDGPTGPSGPRDYTVYLANLATYSILAYHPSTGEVDSFAIGNRPRSQSPVSADGRRLYVAGDSITVVNLSTYAEETVWPTNRGGVAVSPDGRLIAVSSTSTHVLRSCDRTVVFYDTSALFSMVFSDDNRTLFGVYDDASSHAYEVYRARVDIDSVLQPKSFGSRKVRQVLPSVDGNKWFLNSGIRTFQWAFSVYDVVTDDLIFDTVLTPGYGAICLTPDGSYVFFTNPGTLLEGPEPPYSIGVYDIRQNRVIQGISTIGRYGSDTSDVAVSLDRMAVTPDSRWLVAASLWGGRIAVVDIEQLAIVRRDKFGDLSELLPFNCQARR